MELGLYSADNREFINDIADLIFKANPYFPNEKIVQT